jgi:hypothetical protein
MTKLDDKFLEDTEKKTGAVQIAIEMELLKQFDPDKELKEEFEIASLNDLQKYLDA